MNHFFKQESLKEILRYNKQILIICIFLAITSLLLTIKIFTSNEKWVLIPITEPEKRIIISSKGYSQNYLKEWAYHVMQTLMTTSYDTVDAQIEEIKVITTNNPLLVEFFNKHKEFVKSSNIESVFFPKKIEFEINNNSILVSGNFRYWLGSSEKPISQEKTYRLTYKRGVKDLLLLKEVKDVTGGVNND
jgi:conjugal transfer pilus assembly protein TraE